MPRRRSLLTLALPTLLGTLTAACSSATCAPAATGAGAAPGSAAVGSAAPVAASGPAMTLAQTGIVPDWLDRAADPCQDFFAHACGGFLKTAQIPPDRSSWGAVPQVTKEAELLLKQVLEDAVAKPADPLATQLGTYYAACMDEATVDQAGVLPIKPLLDQIAKIKDARSAATAVIALHAEWIFPFFGLGQVQDALDATQVITVLDQDGLGLPDRKYYLDDKGNLAKTRDAYVAHVARTFTLLGQPAAVAKASAATVMKVETGLARMQQDEVVRRDPHATYHRVERAGLEKAAGGFPWGAYLAGLGIPGVTAITVNDPAYFTGVAKLIATTPAADLRTYLTWTVVRETSDQLSKPFVDEAFTMQQALRGMKAQPPRWRRCVERVDDDLGEALGQAFVARRFAGDSKPRAQELTDAVLAAMDVALDGLPWMDAATRAAAKAKRAKIATLIGYPDTWRRYDFAIAKDTFFANVRAARRFELNRQLAKIGKPVDRLDWYMTPPTVNAYYTPGMNEIVLPAGQLQPPFFGAGFHPAVNFGSTGGGTIGHEMTHGFDDEGSQFDGDGNLRDWWSKDTKAKFEAATRCVVDQYAGYEAVPGVKLDGKLTAGENIADIGGVKIGLQAYQAWRAKAATKPPAAVDGYSDEQLYYLAYAQSWCEKDTPEQAELAAHSNPHSPARWRVNGVIIDQPAFAAAFKCTAATPMNPGPGKACAVW